MPILSEREKIMNLQFPEAQPDVTDILRKIVAKGDLSDLTPAEQLRYYLAMCRRHRLDPMSRPFDFLEKIDQRGRRKVILYGNKECAAQLRVDRSVSIYRLDETEDDGVYAVTAFARLPDGREDLDKGVVFVNGLDGEAYANAIKKAVTQAKRRVTLSICGLGMLDDSEVDDVPGAHRIDLSDAPEDQEEHVRKSSSLDVWACGRRLAMRIINISTSLKAAGVSDDVIKSWLPEGVFSRKDLDEHHAEEFASNLALRMRLMSLCARLSEMGISSDEMAERLPEGILLIRDLTLPQVATTIAAFSRWLQQLGMEAA